MPSGSEMDELLHKLFEKLKIYVEAVESCV